MKIDLKSLIPYFWPKFYNRLTWVIVAAGLSLLGNSIIKEILNEILKINYNITLISDYDPLYGLLCITIGLGYNVLIHYLDLKKFTITNEEKRKEAKSIIEHDKKIFEQSDELLNESTLNNNLGRLGGSHEAHDNFLSSIYNTIDFYAKTSNQYLTTDIESAKKEFTKNLSQLVNFIGLNFFTAKRNLDICQMHPDGNWDRSNNVTPESEAHYNEHVTKLMELINLTKSSYDRYRITIKEHLKI